MIRVLIVDDHPIVREGVATVLEREHDIEVVGRAPSTIDEGLRVAATLKPDVVLLDLRLPDATASTASPSFAAREPGILVFTAYDADDDVFERDPRRRARLPAEGIAGGGDRARRSARSTPASRI